MAVLDVWSNLIQDKGDDVRLHGQKEHVALTDGLLVAGCQVNPHFLQRKPAEGSLMTAGGFKRLRKKSFSHMHAHADASILMRITQQRFETFSSHPQARHSGEVRIRGAGCNPLCSNHTWGRGREGKITGKMRPD